MGSFFNTSYKPPHESNNIPIKGNYNQYPSLISNKIGYNQQNRIKQKSSSLLANQCELVGDDKQTRGELLQELSQIIKQNNPQQRGKEMVNQQKEIINQYQLENPIELNPITATFQDVAVHAYRWQRLSQSTIDHRLRCARRMQKHPVYPIDFNNPTYHQFIAYMDYRERNENAQTYALNNDLRTMKMFLRAYNIDERDWFYKLPPAPKHKKKIIPFPETVHKLTHHIYSKDQYENSLYQYLMFHNFYIGWRVPSEPCEMTINDVNIDENGKGTLLITETKKRKSKRTIIPDKTVLSAPTYKSFKNWIDHWRPKVENQYSGDALYLQPNGKPFTVRYLGKKLSEKGKEVWEPYQPYISRHWCAIALLIRTKIETKYWDIRRVQLFLGHDKPQTTDNYIQFAEDYYRQEPIDWLNHALRQTNSTSGGKCEKIKRLGFSALLDDFSPVEEYGLSGI